MAAIIGTGIDEEELLRQQREAEERARRETEAAEKRAAEETAKAQRDAQAAQETAAQEVAKAQEAAKAVEKLSNVTEGSEQEIDPMQRTLEAAQKAQEQGFRRTVQTHAKNTDIDIVKPGEFTDLPASLEDNRKQLEKANRQGKFDYGTTFGVTNKVDINFNSIKSDDQAFFTATTMATDKDKQWFLKQWAEKSKQSYETVLANAEARLGTRLFASPVSKAGKNKAIIDDFNSYGLMDYSGNAVNFNTASLNEIVNLIKTTPDDEMRAGLVETLEKATRQEGNRFYGRTFDATDAKKFLETADLDGEKYDDFVKVKLDGKFYRAPGNNEKNQKTYEDAMTWIDNAGLSEYEKNHYRKAVNLAYERQTGKQYEPPVEKKEDKLGEARAVSERGFNMHMGLANRAPSSTPAPSVTPQPSVAANKEQKVEPVPSPTAAPAPAAEPQKEKQGPVWQPQEEAAPEKPKKTGTDSVSLFYDRAMNNMQANSAANAQGPEQQARAVGTVDFASDPAKALPYIMANEADLLTEGTLDAVDAWVGQSAGRQAMVGVLTGENLGEFAAVGADGKITYELNNRNANSIFLDNYGILGEMTGYALKLNDPNFPKELLSEAVDTLSAAIDDAEYAARNDQTGAYNPNYANIYTEYLRQNPEIEQALDAAFDYEAEVKAKAEEAEKIRFEAEAKAKQERIDQARAACRTGDATPEDWAIVTQEAPDLTDEQLRSDATFKQLQQDITLDRTFSDAEEGGWFNEQATAYLRGKGINAKAGSVAQMEAKDLFASYLTDAAAQMTETAYALGYENLGAYLEKTGIGMETMQEIALYNLRAVERDATPEVVDKATEIAQSRYTGTGDAGFFEAAGKSIALGANEFVASKMEAWYTFAATTNIPVDAARARALYTNRFGYARAESKLSDQLLSMANEGYFPNEQMNAYVQSYLLNGGNAFDLGIVPEDLGYVVEWSNNAKKRAEGIQAWAEKTLTPGQGRWFELGASTTVNFSNQLMAAGLNIITGGAPGAALINSMLAYGDGAFNEGFERGIGKGYGLRDAGMLGVTGALAVAMANMGSDKKRAAQLSGLTSMVELGVGNAPLPRTLAWYKGVGKAALLSTADTLVDEVLKDEFKEGVYSGALGAGAEALIEGADIATAARVALGNTNVIGNAMNVLKNAPENLFHMAPMALLSGTVAGAKEWRSYRELNKAMKTGKAEDIQTAEKTFVQEMQEPDKAKAFEEGMALADKTMRTAEILADDIGEIGSTIDAASTVQEQADSHKEKLDASQAALDEAVAQHEEAIEAVIAGNADENTVQQANDSAEAISQNQTSVSEHQKEYNQKQAEADALYQEATDKATAQASQQIVAEQAAAQAAQEKNDLVYSGSPLHMTKNGQRFAVTEIVGKDDKGFPIVKLDTGDIVSFLDDPQFDFSGEENASDFVNQFTRIADNLPTLEHQADGTWAETATKQAYLDDEIEMELAPSVKSGEKVTVVNVAGVSEVTGDPVLELSDGTLVSWNTLAYGYGENHQKFSDIAKANTDKLPKLKKGEFLTLKDMKEKYAKLAEAPKTLLGQEYDVEFTKNIGEGIKAKVVDIVGVTNSGKAVVELSDGTKTNVLAFKSPELKKAAAEIVEASKDTLPVFEVGQYDSVSVLKDKYVTGGSTNKSETGAPLESWQTKQYHGAVSEPKKASTDTPAFKAWFNDPTAEKLLTNPDGTPKVIYRGFGGMGKGNVYMEHESKPYKGKSVNFYSAGLDMSKSYASGNPNIVKHYNIKNWETAKAAMKDMQGDLITDSVKQGYQVINRDGSNGKFYKEYELDKFNEEYGNLRAAGVHAGYVSVQKPLVLDAKGKDYTNLTATVMDKNGNAHTDTKKARWWAHWAWDNGYDSVIIKNVKDNLGNNSAAKPDLKVITSESSMFKSIYNTGKFDKANKDIRYYKPGTFALTGEPVSQQMKDVQNRLSIGEKVALEDLYSIPELQYALDHEKKGSSKEDFANDPEREAKQQDVLEELTMLGSAESIMVDGKPKVVYTGDIKQERRIDIVIGPPAAGKSSVLVDPLSHMFKSRVVDSDMAKELLPEYEGGLNSGYLHEESGMIAKQLLKESMQRGDNIVYPVVGWHLDSLRGKIADYKDKGYSVYLHLNELPIEKALGRMLNRLLTDGRYILPEYPLETVGNKPSAVFEILKSEEVADGYSKWSNDVEYGKDPVLLYGDGKTEQPVLEGRSLLRQLHTGGERGDQAGAPPSGPQAPDAGTPPQNDIKYLKSTPSNQGASSMPAAKSSGKAKSPLQVAKKLADDIGTAIYATKKLTDPNTLTTMPAGVQAYYSNMLDSVGVRTKDQGRLVNMFHELTHALGNKTGMKGTQQMIDALPDDFKRNYTAAELPDEALAEFGWRYFYSPQAAEAMAGAKFVSDFERALKKAGLYKDVKEAQEDIQFYRNQNVTGQTLAHVVDAPTKRKATFHDFLGKAVDETAPLRPMLYKIMDRLGSNKLQANMNPVVQARQAQTASIRADRVFDNGVTDANWKLVAKGYTDRVAKYLKTDEDYNDYIALLLDRHALERNAQNKPVFDSFLLSDSMLQDNIDRITATKPDVVKAADETYAFWNDVMQNYMVDTGFLSPQAWDVLKKVNPFYVPTMRDKGTSVKNTVGGGDTFTVKRATGSTEDIINPIVSMRAMVEQMVKQVSRNNVALSIDRAYKAFPDALSEFLEPVGRGVRKTQDALTKDEVDEIVKNLKPGDDLMQAIFDKMEEKAAFSTPSRSGESNTLVVQHPDGTTTEYKVLDPEILRAVAGAGEKGVHGLAQAIARITRTMSALTTSDNPMYGLMRNPSKDISESIKWGSWATSYLDGIPKWIIAMTDVARGTDAYKQYLATGAGGLSAFRGNNLSSTNKFLNTLFPGRKAKTKAGRLVSALDTAMDVVSIGKFAEWIEQTSRYAEAKYGGELNLNNANADAGDLAQLGVNTRDVTVDFYGKGSEQIMADIACVSPFFKAAMNGVYRQARMYADPLERNRLPARLAKTVLNTALASAASSLLMLRTLDDEEKTAYTDYLSQNLKTLHWYLPNPAYDSGKSDKRFIRIPLPQDAASYAIHAAVTNAIWLGQEDSMAIEASALMDTIISSVSPYNGTIFKPFIDAAANRTWYGGYIVPRTMTDYKKISEVNQYTETTPTAFRWAAQVAHGLGIEVSPMKLQYVTEQLGGYPAKMLVAALSPDEYTGELGGWDAVANVWEKTMTSDPYVSQDMTSTYYDAKDMLTRIKNDAEGGYAVAGLKFGLSQKEVDDAVSDAKALLKGPIDEGGDAINEMYDTIEEINKNQSLSSKQKNDLIREARRECFEILADVNAELWAYQEKYCTGEGLIGHFIKNTRPYSLAK